MGITFSVLGALGRDNALFVRVDAGTALHRLLFDCGEACAAALPTADLLNLDHLCFSHLHMDHVAGFDTLFRATYNRADTPNVAWGPPGTGRILQHRFQGYLWNLHADEPGAWLVHDVHPDHVERRRYRTGEAYAVEHDEGAVPCDGMLLGTSAFTLATLQMDHHTPSLAYVLRERPRVNVDAARLTALGLAPGSWLRALREPRADETPEIEVGGVRHPLAALRRELLVESPGDSIAYLTDFLLDDAAMQRLVPLLAGVKTVVCECQYRAADAALAARNRHMTAPQVAELARRAGAGDLVLFHLSDRYRPEGWAALLEEARAIFPATRFPEGWEISERQ